jgi:hypothetical protein
MYLQEENLKMKYTFSQLIKEHSYHNYRAMEVIRDDGKKCHGFLYTLFNEITLEERKRLAEFNNVKMFVSACQYAPEIKKSAIFIGNSFIRKGVK